MVTFSQLLASMRMLIVQRITDENTSEQELLVLTLGSLEARHIKEPFFTMCRLEAAPAGDADAIAKRLETSVKDEIEERNRIAHADWHVARWSRADGEVPIAARVRVNPANKQEPVQHVPYKVGDIDKLCDRAELLRNVVWEYGSICLRRGNYRPERGVPVPVITDVLQIHDGQVIYRFGPGQVPWPP